MSSSQKRYQDQMEAQSRAAQAQAAEDRRRMLQDTPQTAWLRDIAKRGAEWIAGKNFSSPPPGMFKYDLSAPGKRQKMREADMNLQPTGAYALGAANANPTALAMARQRLNDQMDQDDAANYEQAVNSYMDEVKALNASLADFDFSRDNALLGNATSRWQTATNNWGQTANARASVWPSLLGGVLGGAGQVGAAWMGRTPS